VGERVKGEIKYRRLRQPFTLSPFNRSPFSFRGPAYGFFFRHSVHFSNAAFRLSSAILAQV
jgi:hypothetical protein